METLFAKQDRLLSLTSTEIIRTLMYQINWDAQLVAIKGPSWSGKDYFNVAVYEAAL